MQFIVSIGNYSPYANEVVTVQHNHMKEIDILYQILLLFQHITIY
jgi:hypothetical protein